MMKHTKKLGLYAGICAVASMTALGCNNLEEGSYMIKIGKETAIYSAEYDFHHPDKCKLTFGNRNPEVRILDIKCNDTVNKISFETPTETLGEYSRDQLDQTEYKVDKLDDLLKKAKELAIKQMAIDKNAANEDRNKKVNKYLEGLIPLEAEKNYNKIE